MKVAVFLPSLAGGGAERVTLALAEGLAGTGLDVHLVLAARTGELAGDVPTGLTVHDLRARRALFSVFGLMRFLRRERPDVVVSAISHANVIAALAVTLLGRRSRLIVMHHNTTSISTRHTPRRRDRLIPLLCGVAYRAADRVIAVSHGVAADLARSSRLPRARIDVLPNPIDYERIRRLAAEPPVPVGDVALIVAAGRLTEQKGFDVLLRALARLGRPGRLLILGDGPLRGYLERLAVELGVADRVTFAGFVANPYPYFDRADVYALSSRWEGLPTVLLEALAFDLRIVATDCPSGPDEILARVKGAELVPVDDPTELAAALDRALAAGPLESPRDDWRDYDSPRVIAQLAEVVRG